MGQSWLGGVALRSLHSGGHGLPCGGQKRKLLPSILESQLRISFLERENEEPGVSFHGSLVRGQRTPGTPKLSPWLRCVGLLLPPSPRSFQVHASLFPRTKAPCLQSPESILVWHLHILQELVPCTLQLGGISESFNPNHTVSHLAGATMGAVGVKTQEHHSVCTAHSPRPQTSFHQYWL